MKTAQKTPLAPQDKKILSNVTMEWITVTPAMAQEWLDKYNLSNRNRSDSTVHKYSCDMRNGAWLITHQGIAFDEENLLLDGQQRLMAIVESGVAVTLPVFRGFPKCVQNGVLQYTQDAMDRHRGRTTGQQLGLRHGYQYGNQVAAAAKAIGEICAGRMIPSITTAQTLKILDIYGKHIEAVVSQAAMSADRKQSILGPIAMAIKGDRPVGEQFCRDFFQMEGLASGHPVLVLRRWIGNNHKATGGSRWTLAKVVANAIYATATASSKKRLGSTEAGFEWLRSTQKSAVRTISEMLE
jgi:hypothetical protein